MMVKRRAAGYVVAFSVTLAAATTARAQSPAGRVTFNASWRVRLEMWDWFQTTGPYDGSYGFVGSLVRFAASGQTSRADWRIEFSQPSLLGLPNRAVAPAPQGALGLGANYYVVNGGDDANVFLKQAFLLLKNAGNPSSLLRVGRFEFVGGLESIPKDRTLAWLKRVRIAHRLLGNFGFSHVQRSFDGVQWSLDTRRMNVTFLAARPTQGVFDTGGWKNLDVDVLYGSLTLPQQRSDLGLFVLATLDHRKVLKTDNRPAAARHADRKSVRVASLGGYYLGVLEAGKASMDLTLWGAYQLGRWGKLDQAAWAWLVEVGLQFPRMRAKPWLRAGWMQSSGDGDPQDGTHRTFFQHLPTPRLYARFPFYNMMNLQDAFVQLMLRPVKRLALRSEAHALRLSNKKDLWYAGGGAFNDKVFGYAGRPSFGNRNLAAVFDLSASLHWSNWLSTTFYAGHAIGGGVVRSIYASRHANFAYIEFVLHK